MEMNRRKAIEEINQTQDYYVNKLFNLVKEYENLNNHLQLKEINFTSPTGTGKTIMIAKLMNLMSNYFFIITSLSKGQLKNQIESSLAKNTKYNNFTVYGLNDYTKNTIIQAEDIISELPKDKKIIWIRDEGHIATNRWSEILSNMSSVIINFSATNKEAQGIQCNFSHTMMLRTVSQYAGTPEDAILKLLDVKRNHKSLHNYNPCALFRCMNKEIEDQVVELCIKYNLKYINITNESFDIKDLCKDDSEYDIIINKFKITEGIDLRRCHVIYMDNKPNNEATIVQVIGRARRNALLWRNDIDIFDKANAQLLKDTRKCYIYYNIPDTKVYQNENGELSYSLCDTISIEKIKPNTSIYVENGQLKNGLYVLELKNRTGWFDVMYDKDLQVNYVDNPDFYIKEKYEYSPYSININYKNLNVKKIYVKDTINEFFQENIELKDDLFKRNYLLYERFLERKKIAFDKDKFRSIMGIGNIYHKASYMEYFKVKKLIENLNTNNIPMCDSYFDRELSDKVANLAKYTLGTPKQKISKNIFDEDAYVSQFNQDFLPYIEAIECIDFSVKNKIEKCIFSNYVNAINKNEYIVANHPLTCNISSDINTLDKLKNKVDKAKKTFKGLSKEQWAYIFDNISRLDNLNTFEIEKLNLFELNERYKIGLTEIDMDDYLSNRYHTHIETNIHQQELLEYDTSKNIFEYSNCKTHLIYPEQFKQSYYSYTKIVNDEEIAKLGPDEMRFNKFGAVEDSALTNKIVRYSKLKKYLLNRYKEQIDSSLDQLFTGKNNFKLDSRCNSCLGYCSEYYAKYLLYGEEFFHGYLEIAKKEANSSKITNEIIIRACMLMYLNEMRATYGSGVGAVIKTMSVESLVKSEYKEFVSLVVKLGTRAANFIDDKINIRESIKNDGMINDPNLSVNHITALCDFINKDTIIDLKCTNYISFEHVLQVLGYHYLSTKRSDLNIKHLYVYDAVSQKFLYMSIDGGEEIA